MPTGPQMDVIVIEEAGAGNRTTVDLEVLGGLVTSNVSLIENTALRTRLDILSSVQVRSNLTTLDRLSPLYYSRTHSVSRT